MEQGNVISLSSTFQMPIDLCSLTAIQSMNLSLIEQRAYRDMKTYDPASANYHYTLLSRDASTLYRMYHKSEGVNVTHPAEQNVHSWLDPASPTFKPSLCQAIFYYRTRLCKEDRLKVYISTLEMDKAVWRYVHHNQLIIDGTFGVCSSRLLLFIAMGIDDSGKGLPVTLFLFSAPTGNQATHAGYNKAILRELLEEWKTHLSKGHQTQFTPYVAITDTDTKERGALLDVWTDIWLLLCKFHVRQCWTNKRKTLKLTSSKSLGEKDFWKHHIHSRLQNMEAR